MAQQNPLKFLEAYGFDSFAPGWARLIGDFGAIDVRACFGRVTIEWFKRVKADNVIGTALEDRAKAVLDIPDDDAGRSIEDLVLGLLSHEEIRKIGMGIKLPDQDCDELNEPKQASGFG